MDVGPTCEMVPGMLLTAQNHGKLAELSLESLADLSIAKLPVRLYQGALNLDCAQPHSRKQMAAEQYRVQSQMAVVKQRHRRVQTGCLKCKEAAPAVEYA